MALAVASAAAVTAPATTALLGRSSRTHLSNGGRSSVSLKAASVNRAFGLKASQSRVTCFKVTLQMPEGKEEIFDCSEDDVILDIAEEEGHDLPFSCRAGACSSCLGVIVSGEVDQDDGSFLEPEQLAAGQVLTCVAKPTSDVVVKTHMEGQVD